MSTANNSSPDEWVCYQIALRLAAPLHVGWRAFGNIRQTRPYIPGRTLWGALTARLARDVYANDYQAAAATVQRDVRFGYLYPVSGELTAAPACWPWGADAGEFAWRYLGSYTSTALRDGRSKLDGSLHEMEYLAPFTRDGHPVCLAGPLWIRRGSPPDILGTPEALAPLLSRLVAGAERGYGWGRFHHVRICPIEPGHFLPGTDWRWSTEAGQVTLSNPNTDSHLLAHLTLSGNLRAGRDLSVPPGKDGGPQGLLDWAIEPLVGRTTPLKDGHRSAGSQIPIANLCAVPGSRVAAASRYSVAHLGLWRTPGALI